MQAGLKSVLEKCPGHLVQSLDEIGIYREVDDEEDLLHRIKIISKYRTCLVRKIKPFNA